MYNKLIYLYQLADYILTVPSRNNILWQKYIEIFLLHYIADKMIPMIQATYSFWFC